MEIVEKTLQKMRLGGIFDQVGYGYHRYSTDAAWRLPHFEKMLYDQAMLVLVYAEAFQATGKEQYALVVRKKGYFISGLIMSSGIIWGKTPPIF